MDMKKFIAIIVVVCIMIALSAKSYTNILPRVQVQEVSINKDTKESMIVDDRGEKHIGYSLEFNTEKGMLSRDGSKCIEVTSGIELDRIGTYYLTTQGEMGNQEIIKVKIIGEAWQDHYQINTEEELEEVFKRALEGFVTTFSFQLLYGELTLEQVNQHVFDTIENLMKHYPQLMFESYIIMGHSGINPTVNIEITYPIEDIEKLKIYQQMMEKKLTDLLANMMESEQQDYEREWRIYQYVIQNVSYGLKVIGEDKKEVPLPMMHTLYGALIEGIAVCDGYAKAVMYLFNNVGIPTEFIVGEADNVLHAWNKVKIQNEYYYVDATWGDLENQQIGGFYNYFNENRAYMEQTHSWQEENKEQATHTTYNLIYLPIAKEGLSKVSTQEEWEMLLEQFQAQGIQEASVVFYDIKKNKWDDKEIIAQLCNQMQSSLEYHTIEKYDALIVNYRLYKEANGARK